jgi:hypothetical protein
MHTSVCIPFARFGTVFTCRSYEVSIPSNEESVE